jgi:hypothetical protein
MTRTKLLGLLCAAVMTGCGPSADDLTGAWDGSSSEWGKVDIRGLEGTYTDTYGPPPGTLSLERTGPRAFRGTWKEDARHGGTMTFAVSEDGRTAVGTYKTWESSPRRPGHEGKVLWKRQ